MRFVISKSRFPLLGLLVPDRVQNAANHQSHCLERVLERGEAPLPTARAFLLTVELFCLQSIEVLRQT